MTVYLAWAADDPDDHSGPWQEIRAIAPGLWLIESTETLSVVYHALKWSLPDAAAIIVSPVDRTPKLRGMEPGTTTCLRERTDPLGVSR